MQEEGDNKDDAPRRKHVPTKALCKGILGSRDSRGVTPLLVEAMHRCCYCYYYYTINSMLRRYVAKVDLGGAMHILPHRALQTFLAVERA